MRPCLLSTSHINIYTVERIQRMQVAGTCFVSTMGIVATQPPRYRSIHSFLNISFFIFSVEGRRHNRVATLGAPGHRNISFAMRHTNSWDMSLYVADIHSQHSAYHYHYRFRRTEQNDCIYVHTYVVAVGYGEAVPKLSSNARFAFHPLTPPALHLLHSPHSPS